MLVGLFITGIGYMLISQDEETPASTASRSSDTVPSSAQRTTNGSGGFYLEYSSANIEQTVARKLLFFHAPWCPQCRAIESDIKRDGVPEGLAVIKVDYDSNQDLRRKYGVTIQTTFVEIDNEGNLISRYVAYDEPTFDAVKRNFL